MRIDYEPDRGTSSLALRAFRDGSWVGSAFLSPRSGRDNDRLQRVIDVLTERGVNARALSARLRSVGDGAGEDSRAVNGETEAEFDWPGPDPLGTDAFESPGGTSQSEPRPAAVPEEHPVRRADAPAGEGARAPAVETAPASRAETWYPPPSDREARPSEVFASRADLEADAPGGPASASRSVVVRLPNGAALVLPAESDAPLSHALARTLASSTHAAQVVRRHAEDLLAAAERVCLLTAAAIPGLDRSSRDAWLRGAQLLVSWRIGDVEGR